MESDKAISTLDKLKIIVFYGPAGTGKSRRAQLIARTYEVDFIVDDGLVIYRGQIVCGKSAKSERNQIRAIRRAMFQFEDHKNQVKYYLKKQSGTIMLIATSKEMALKIIKTLDLPYPFRFIAIEDVATPDEIKKARQERINKGQHVIPVSQVQVRKNFAGQLVGKLRVFWQPLHPQDGEKTIVRPPFTFYGDLHIESEAIEQIAIYIGKYTKQVDEVLSIKIKSEEEYVLIAVDIRFVLGDNNMMQISKLLQRRIRKGIEYFTGLGVKKIDIQVSEIVSGK